MLVLVAALVGGGTAAGEALSKPTPTGNHQPQIPASHGSGSTGGGSRVADPRRRDPDESQHRDPHESQHGDH